MMDQEIASPAYITDIPCDILDCAMPVEIVKVLFSSCEEGHVCCLQYQCIGGHEWEKVV